MFRAYDNLLQMPVDAAQAMSDDEKYFRYECLCCGEEVYLAAQNSKQVSKHFRHRNGNNDKKCELYSSQNGSIHVSTQNLHNKHERVDFYFDNTYKLFCFTLCFNEDELKFYEAKNVKFEISCDKNEKSFFSKEINKQDFCENIPEKFVLEKYARTYYISNTLYNRKKEYFLFEDNAPTFFKIQGDSEDYKAKYVKSRYIYTKVRYFIAWVGCNAAQIRLKNKKDVVIEDQCQFTTFGNRSVWGMVVTFKKKNPEIDTLLQSWGYNLSAAEELLLLWPPACTEDDTNYIPCKKTFLYSTFKIQYGNANIFNKDIHYISSNVAIINCQETTRVIKKNVDISIKLDKSEAEHNFIELSVLYKRTFVVPNEDVYYRFTKEGTEKLSEGQKVILTPDTVIAGYKNDYPIVKIFYEKITDITLEARFRDILSNYWVCEKYCDEKTEKYQEIPIIDEYLLCCKQNECINSAVIKFLKERE